MSAPPPGLRQTRQIGREPVGWFIRHEEPLPRHLTQSIALEESALPHIARVGVALIGAIMASFLIWAANTEVEEIASAMGQVIPSSHVQTIQHLEGGIVKSILVRDGQLVEQDQPLLQLDDTSAGADLGQIRAREQALAMQAERLRRFTGSGAHQDIVLSEKEQAILRSMEDARASQRAVISEQLAQKQQELKRLTSLREALEKNVALLDRENAIRQYVAQKGYGSLLTALTSERELNQMRGQLDDTTTQVEQAKDAIRESQSRLTSVDADLRQEAMKTLGQVEGELAQVRESLEKIAGTARRTLITSPMRGLVKGLSVNTLGAVAEPGKVLLEIVPVDSELMVEAMVLPTDVGHLRPGQTVNVKVSAYEFSRYGTVPGLLENVSATTFVTPDGRAFYKTKVKLERTYVGKDPARNIIMPGMTVQADIITGSRTVLQYLLKPIYVSRLTAFHER